MEQIQSGEKRAMEEEEEEDNDEEAQTKKKTTMTPWEQHSAVISISSLLRRSHSGFLITCTISRGRRAPPKKPCASLKSIVGHLLLGRVITWRWMMQLAGKLSEDVSSQTEEDIGANKSPALSLVKLTGSGLLLFTFPHDTIQIVSDIIDFLGSGDSSSPQ